MQASRADIVKTSVNSADVPLVPDALGNRESSLHSSPSSVASSQPSEKLHVQEDYFGMETAISDPRSPGSVFLQRVHDLPLVQGLLRLYAGVKSLPFVGLALTVGEVVAGFVVIGLVPWIGVCEPVISLYKVASCADRCMCKGLDVVETVLPCISVLPLKMFEITRTCLVRCVCCLPRCIIALIAQLCSASKI
ncbi:Protein of unknown function [Gryllus bimaculatus]|nr:Protein of unknown function [Gryllus bimaculatus]